VLVRPIATGICGSDLHVLDVQVEDPEAYPAMVLGHEFCAEVLDAGPGTSGAPKAGTLVCSVPFIDGPLGPELVGLTPNFPGGFAELMVLQAARLLPVPDGLDPARAAVTEPLAVGVHAVRTARLAARDVALVVGCGPIGLAVISALKAGGHGPVVAADFSAARRALAERAGADVVVDPASVSPYDTWLGLAGEPLPPSPLLTAGSPAADTVVFDCVGAPGLMEAIITAVPSHTRIVVVGVCAASDSFVPVRAIEKELSVQYVFAYRPEEFADALALIADGTVDVGPWITGTCDLDHVDAAFTDLRSADTHCKIIVAPGAAREGSGS
jgi:2-desacetyl-2-hydroxyethyl bacteriochlorophyllide A dehydrogenase